MMDPQNALSMLKTALPLLKAMGIDPQRYASQLERSFVRGRMEAHVSAIVRDLEQHGLTPAGDGKVRRQMVRSAMFQLVKHALPISQGAGHVADIIRDSHEKKVVPLVIAQLQSGTSTEAAVRATMDAFLERLF